MADDTHVFNTYNDADKYIQQFCVENDVSFVKRNTKNVGNYVVKDFNNRRIWFEDARGQIPVSFDGTPFVNMGVEVRECHHGPLRKKNKKSTEEKTSDPSYGNKRKRNAVQVTKKQDCQATIRMRIIVKFPQYKIENPSGDTKQQKVCSTKLRNEFSPEDTEQQLSVLVKICGQHSGHVLGECSFGMATEGQVKWRGKKSATGCLQYLCLSETLADVWLTFNDEGSVRIPAHKFVLRMRSEVFEAMLDDQSYQVHFDDISKEVMEHLLRFLYTDEIHLNKDNVFHFLYAAQTFMLEGLHDQCVQFLLKSVEATNVCDIYERVQGYDVENIVSTACLEYIWRHAWNVFTTESFLQLSMKSLAVILDSDNLTGEEVLAFRALAKWAEHQCISNNEQPRPETLQTHIKDLIYKIRFPLMSIEEFTEEVQPKNLLSPEDNLLLFQFISAKDDDRNSQLEKFNVNPRNGGIMTEQIFNSYPDPDRVTDWCDQKCCMFIMTTEDIRLHSLKGPLIKYITAVKTYVQSRSEGAGKERYETRTRLLETEDMTLWQPAHYSVSQENGEIIFKDDPLLMPDTITYIRMELIPRPGADVQNVDPLAPPSQGKRARGAGKQNRQNIVPVVRAVNMSMIVKKTTVSLTLIPPGINHISFR